MHICYFDESGDDGYPRYSSQLFILSSLYFNQRHWKENYDRMKKFRAQLKDDYGFPIKMEFHTNKFLADKGPYHGVYTIDQRREIMELFSQMVGSLEAKIINVVIDKANITDDNYLVLEKALSYNIQRIENDMNHGSTDDKNFMIITDEGRVGKMRKVSRKIQRVNYIPSKYHHGSYRKEIEFLIEDPLPKRSEDSYFIQLADYTATIIMLYARQYLSNPTIDWANRVRRVIKNEDVIQFLNNMKPTLNTKASGRNEFGVVYYPNP